MNKVIVHGHCSARYRWPTWPDFFHHYSEETQLINLAKPGISNETIARDVVNAVNKYKNISHIYVMWGAPFRYEVFQTANSPGPNTKDMWTMWDEDFKWTVTYNGKHGTDTVPGVDRIKTLESILYTQLFLKKHNVQSTMMIYDTRTLPINIEMTKPETALRKEIDWSMFKFYNGQYGLLDFANDLYPEHFPDHDEHKGDRHLHPLPFVHYKWTKDVIFASEKKLAPQDEYKLQLWKTLDIKDDKWKDEATRHREWENDA
jgi:hypothetical protein